jgi:DNA repair exonuclease SbcCD ATPase subunit
MSTDTSTVSDDGKFITIPSLAEAGSAAFADEAAKVTGNDAPPAPATNANSRIFTEDEVEAIRKQEKDKLYNKLSSLEEQLKSIAEERDEARKAASQREEAELNELKRREEEELSAKELISRKEREWEDKLNSVNQEWETRWQSAQQEAEAKEALLEKERAFAAVTEYKARRIAEEQESIIPELLPLLNSLGGGSPEEVESNINLLKERSYAILESVSQATQQQQGRPRGAQVTAPPTGPVETHMEQQTLSADDIRNMPMDMYVQMRDRLLKARPNGRF